MEEEILTDRYIPLKEYEYARLRCPFHAHLTRDMMYWWGLMSPGQKKLVEEAYYIDIKRRMGNVKKHNT